VTSLSVELACRTARHRIAQVGFSFLQSRRRAISPARGNDGFTFTAGPHVKAGVVLPASGACFEAFAADTAATPSCCSEDSAEVQAAAGSPGEGRQR